MDHPIRPRPHHVPDMDRALAAARLEQLRRAARAEDMLDREGWLDEDIGDRNERMEQGFRRLREREERAQYEGGALVDPMTSHCAGCGRLRPLWELDMVRVPPAELPEGAPMTLRLICKAHDVPAVAAPAHEWERITVPDQTREAREAEVIERIDAMIAELGGTEALTARRAARDYPPVRPLPPAVPERATVGFWRRVTGRQGRIKEA